MRVDNVNCIRLLIRKVDVHSRKRLECVAI